MIHGPVVQEAYLWQPRKRGNALGANKNFRRNYGQKKSERLAEKG